MALFTDGPITTIQDLIGYESSILDVARTEGIDLTTKTELAYEEVAIELEALLARQSAPPKLETVVVTDALHKWETFRALALVYRDAFNRQLNDRYLGKWREYQRLARWASEALLQKGVGVTDRPTPRAKKPQLSGVSGPHSSATYYVQIAWLNDRGEEGGPSEVQAITLADGVALTVTPAEQPANTTGWNVYAGFAPAGLTRQNTQPLPGNSSWTLPATGLRTGQPAGTGQSPQEYIKPVRAWLRG